MTKTLKAKTEQATQGIGICIYCVNGDHQHPAAIGCGCPCHGKSDAKLWDQAEAKARADRQKSRNEILDRLIDLRAKWLEQENQQYDLFAWDALDLIKLAAIVQERHHEPDKQ